MSLPAGVHSRGIAKTTKTIHWRESLIFLHFFPHRFLTISASNSFTFFSVSMAASLPPLACCNRSMETLAASNCCAFNAASPVPSRISCPSSRPRFAFIVDPLKAGNRQQCQQQADASCTPSMRNRTKSLDNGLKFSSSTPQRSRKMHRNGNNNCAGNGSASIEPIRRKCHNDSIAQQQQHSRLEQAKQFLRRFYASSTLRLAGRKRKTMLAPNETNTRVEPNGALMFSSAVGPFFEFRCGGFTESMDFYRNLFQTAMSRGTAPFALQHSLRCPLGRLLG